MDINENVNFKTGEWKQRQKLKTINTNKFTGHIYIKVETKWIF